MFRRRRKPLLATNDMGYAHVVVIDNIGQVIGGQPIGLDEYLVVDRATFERYLSPNGVGE